MRKIVSLAFGLAMAASASVMASAADTQAQPAADKDFGKLSVDGGKAVRDVRLARLAIFDGHPDKAKSYIDEAQGSIDKAKTDDTVFTKAESDLKAPAGVTQPTGGKAQPDTTAIKWIPVDGSMTLGEDFVATPEKAASVAKANAQLKTGNHKQAMETLKLADVDVSVVEEVAPLDKTVQGIDSAAQLIGTGKYYEANQALKGVEDGLRFDVVDFTGTPQKASGKPAASTTTGDADKPMGSDATNTTK